MNEQFAVKEYRDAFVEANIEIAVAYQIRALRKKEGWSQGELGERCGTAQNVISRLEDPDYGKFTIRTLLDIASAFDVALSVRFVSFSELLTQIKDVSPQALAVPSFEQEISGGTVPDRSEEVRAMSAPVFENTYPRFEHRFPADAARAQSEIATEKAEHSQRPDVQSDWIRSALLSPRAHHFRTI
jgi:transcriptional regulator with XRE-family HTH domain